LLSSYGRAVVNLKIEKQKKPKCEKRKKEDGAGDVSMGFLIRIYEKMAPPFIFRQNF
jgi:hypothetical protein